MRNRLTILTAALLLASASLALAQAPQQAAPVAPAPSLGSFDFGYRGTSTDGDEARYERYRDLRNGVDSRFLFSKETGDYLFDIKAFNIGYRDQRYSAGYASKKIQFSFLWDSIPLNYSYMTLTPWNVGDNGVLTLDPAARQAVQGPTNAANDGRAVGVPCAPGAPPAACSNPTTADQAKNARSIYNNLARPFDMQARRDAAGFGLTYNATKDVGVNVAFTTTRKSGEMPWGASFAFNDANEMPLPIDNRTNDFSAGLEWTAPKGMFRVGWDGSWFNNDVKTLVWDNPIRATDFNNGLAPPNGPYDPSGYSNGNGPAQGRMALAPNNMMNVFSLTGLYKLPARTSVNGTFQYTTQEQDETLIPWTINPLINSSAVYAVFPHLASLPRDTAEAKANGLNFLLNLNSRPIRNLGFTVRYRYNERDNETPQFDATEYVRFDAVPEEIEEGFSHQYDTTRQTFDANMSYSLTGWGAVRVGYGHDAYERHGRGFSETGEDTFRISFDTISSQYFSIRAAYDISSREGDGFVETGTDYEEGPGGTQPTLRYYDEADRDRHRASVLFTVTPVDMVDFYVSFANGKDEYDVGSGAPVSRPGELFGLVESEVTSWTLGANMRPNDKVGFGASYGREELGAFQQSRNANPPPDPSWDDPNRNWTLDNDEEINNFNLYLDLLEAIQKTDIRVSYDFSDSDNAFVHGGPRVATLAATPPGQFIALPNVTNQWQRFTVDVKYYLTAKVGVGVGYWYEKLDIEDFNTIDSNGPVGLSTQAGRAVETDPTGIPRIDWLGGLITGYGNRPYKGNTAFVRILYRF